MQMNTGIYTLNMMLALPSNSNKILKTIIRFFQRIGFNLMRKNNLDCQTK